MGALVTESSPLGSTDTSNARSLRKLRVANDMSLQAGICPKRVVKHIDHERNKASRELGKFLA